MNDLTPKQELFCQFYTQNSDLFGNGTLAYAEAYDYDLDSKSRERPILDDKGTRGDSDYDLSYNVCSVQASKLLRNAKIQDRVTALLNAYLKDEVVDAQLMKIIMVGDDKDKVAAIREYNKLRNRVVERVDHTSGNKPIPILNVFTNNSDTESSETQQEN